jgi:hypothetical protein
MRGGVLRVAHRLREAKPKISRVQLGVGDTDTTPTLMITLNYVISQIVIGVDVSVSDICVCIRDVINNSLIINVISILLFCTCILSMISIKNSSNNHTSNIYL